MGRMCCTGCLIFLSVLSRGVLNVFAGRGKKACTKGRLKMLEKGELMRQGPKGRGGDGIKMIDRGNEGSWGVRGLIEEINWYRMKPDVQKANVIHLTLLSRVSC